MFEGSKHVPKGEFDRVLESFGGTTTPRPVRTTPSSTRCSGQRPARGLLARRRPVLLPDFSKESLRTQVRIVKEERRMRVESEATGPPPGRHRLPGLRQLAERPSPHRRLRGFRRGHARVARRVLLLLLRSGQRRPGRHRRRGRPAHDRAGPGLLRVDPGQGQPPAADPPSPRRIGSAGSSSPTSRRACPPWPWSGRGCRTGGTRTSTPCRSWRGPLRREELQAPHLARQERQAAVSIRGGSGSRSRTGSTTRPGSFAARGAQGGASRRRGRGARDEAGRQDLRNGLDPRSSSASRRACARTGSGDGDLPGAGADAASAAILDSDPGPSTATSLGTWP